MVWILGAACSSLALLAASVNALPKTTTPAVNSTIATSTNTTGNWTIGQAVKTKSGTIIGHAAPQAVNVSEYLGIPFAKPPVGNLRFAGPVAFTGAAVINQTSYPPNCPQNAVSLPGLTEAPTVQFIEYLQGIGSGPNTNLNEDCLYLNVWTKPQTGDTKKAVMVWFYPGGFRSGGTANPGINGQYYADQHDVIVVTFNYRVDALGFAAIPGHTPQNVGFLDQRLAMEWVRTNIGSFGGDVDRIVIFGESAGAAGIDYYNYAYTKDPIISGAIMESGSTNLGSAASEVTANTLWNRFAIAGGCTNSTTAQVVACMRSLSSDAILAASFAVSGGGYAFGPVVDNTTVFQDYTTLQAEGDFIKVPLLIGNNDDESAWFKLTKGDLYPESYYQAVNLALFTCVSENLASIRSQFGLPSWRYRFFPTFPDTVHPYNSTIAMHTSEVPLVWGTADDSILAVGTTQDERDLSSLIMTYWSTFVKNPKSGLTEAGWPTFDASTASLALFGNAEPFGNASFVNPSLTDSACPAVVPAYCGS